ncbi:MAG: NAD+ synthase, partial [Solirubrobacteraceae bacterium]
MGDPPRLRLAVCQVDPTVGAIVANETLIARGIAAAREAGADLVLFGELALSGYPPEDLLYKEHFLRDCRAALERLAVDTDGIVAIVGFPERSDRVYNAAAVLSRGAVAGIYRKIHLPNYGVFDEQRYFAPGAGAGVIEVNGRRIGLTVCEDIWVSGSPCSELARAGAGLIVNISASPYHAGKGLERELDVVGARVSETGIPCAFCALVGGQDELVFDGHSFVLGRDGTLLARAAQFSEEMLICDVELATPQQPEEGKRGAVKVLARVKLPVRVTPPPASTPRTASLLEPREAEIYAALECGLRDYVRKNGFHHVVLGLSGGIDSALVAAIATDALGAEHVTAAVMPSAFSSSETQDDARSLAASLGADVLELPIDPLMADYAALLAPAFSDREADTTEENLQARIRGNLLMALSNKFGWLVLTTGNKSEMSVGYSTLYGDSAGGFAVIKDVEKTLVYALARWRNRSEVLIPTSILERPPSAELRLGQRDDDSLPPYEILDAILRGYVEQNAGRREL